MRRILVLGSSGSGKTTFSNQLAQRINVPAIHLDSYPWQPDWAAHSAEDWHEILENLLLRDSWVMDGNYTHTLDRQVEFADTVVFLDLPRLVCLWRCIKRLWQHWGAVRPELPDGCYEKMDWEFFLWIWHYPRRSRPTILKKLAEKASNHKIFILKTNRQIQDFLNHAEPVR